MEEENLQSTVKEISGYQSEDYSPGWEDNSGECGT